MNGDGAADWHGRVVRRSLRTATQRSIDRGASLVGAATRLLERSNGDVFTVRIVPLGQFIAVAANPGPGPSGFVQMQIDKDGRLGVLRLSFDDGQAYDFRRE